MLNKIIASITKGLKSYSPANIKKNWKEQKEKEELIERLSKKTGLKKVYFHSLSEDELNREVKKMKDSKILRLSEGAYRHYKSHVRGNTKISMEEARLKLTRNVLLAQKSKGKNGATLYKYGCLWMAVKGNTILWVNNHNQKPHGWKKNFQKYEQLNVELGIND